MCVSVNVCIGVQVSMKAHGEHWLPGAGVTGGCRLPMWVLGTRLGSCERAVNGLSC